MRRKFVTLAVAGAICLSAVAPAFAFEYPSEDVEVIYSGCPTGLDEASLDQLAAAAQRIYDAQIALLTRLEARLGHPIENEWFAIEICGQRFLIDPMELYGGDNGP